MILLDAYFFFDLLDAADHDFDERRFLVVLQCLLVWSWLFQQKVCHALPVLHHVVGLDEGVDQVGAVLVKLRLDEELHQVAHVGGVGQTLLAPPGPQIRVHFLFFREESHVQELPGCLCHGPTEIKISN